MKKTTLSLFIGVSLIGSTFAQTFTLNRTATPSLIHNTNTTFSFTKFDSSLGTLTAIDLLLTSATLGGSVSLQADGDNNILNSFNSSIRTTGTGFTQQNSPTSLVTSFSPGPGTTVTDGTTTTFTLIGSPQIISSTQIYSLTGDFSSFQSVGGIGNTPNFSAQVRTPNPQGISGAPGTGIFSGASLTAAASYTLQYSYTTTAPIPEPGQVAASLLLLSGIGAYVFIKRRKKSAPAAA